MVQQKLVGFVERALIRGKSEQEIHDGLVEKGWDEERVRDAFAQVEREIEDASEGERNGAKIRAAAILTGVIGTVLFVPGIVLLISNATRSVPPPTTTSVVFPLLGTVLGVGILAGSYGTWRWRWWGRYIALGVLYLLSIPLFTLPITYVLLYYLHTRSGTFS